MILVLDTNILIDLQKGNEKTKNTIRKIVKEYPYPAKITVFSKFEFITGLLGNPVKNESKVKEFISGFSVLQTTEKSPLIFAELKNEYDKKGLQIPLIDLLIAGLVIENNLVLVTKDKDFEKIKELKKIMIKD